MTIIEEGAMRAPASPPAQSPLVEDELNKRIVIWAGDITTLDVDVIVNPTDETLTECNPISSRILLAAGPELKEHLLTKGYECRPCEAIVTPGYALRCPHIIHAVCPQYSHKQHQASMTALHNCYTNVLYKAWSLGARSIALPGAPPRGHFPPDAHQHTLRTIRRFLWSHAAPALVLVVGAAPSPRPHVRIIRNPATATLSEDDTSFDSELASEAAALFRGDTQRLLPSAAASPSASPLHQNNTAEVVGVLFGSNMAMDTMAVELPDLSVHSPQPPLEETAEEKYERLLRRAHSTDLNSVSGIGCLYQSGVDRLGRPVVVFIGKWFPIADVDLDKALLYLIKLLDPIVRGDYVIAYFHTMASSHNHPPFAWLKEVYTVLPYKYKKNLKAFYIVHPTFWTKMMTWWFTTFMAPAIKAKVHNLPGVEYLYSVMARDQLEVPAFVTEYDMTINGLHYFQPDTNNT